jgi:DNA repair protein SbcC/Rad50
MIPKYLKIKGLYSYQEEAEIDFDKLSEAHIFGIFGRVGSGKSSILEAITLALYGEVSRMSASGRNYNLMNLKSNQLHIEFIFEAAADTYRIVVDAERNRKNFDKVESYKFRYFKQEVGQWQPMRTFDPKEIIGLEIENFTKAVIIPQNHFHEFLMMKDSDRNTMLKNLFSLEQYDLSVKLKELDAENSAQLQVAQAQFEPIKEVSKTYIDDRNKAYSELQITVIDNEKQLKNGIEKEATMKALQRQFEQLEKLKNEADELEKGTPQYFALEKQLERYNLCRLHFQNTFERQKTVSQKLVETKNNLDINKQQLVDNQLVMTSLNTAFDVIKKQYAQKDTLKNDFLDLENILILKNLKADFLVKNDSLSKGEVFLKDKKTAIETLKNEKNTLENERQNLRSKLPDYAQLNDIKNWFSAQNTLQFELKRQEDEIGTFTEKLDIIETNKRYILKNDLPLFNIKLKSESSLSEIIQSVKNEYINLKNKKSSKEKALQHDLAIARVEDLAESLNEGDPCPLCGSVHHPSVMSATDIKASTDILKKEIEKLENQLISLKNIEIQFDTHSINFNKINFDRKEKINAAQESALKIQKHAANFTWQNHSSTDENAINEAFNSADALKKETDMVEEKIKMNAQKIDAENAVLEKANAKISLINAEISGINGQILTTQKQIKMSDISPYLLKEKEDIEQQIKTLKNNVENIEKTYTETDEKLRQITEKVGVLKGGVDEAEKNFKNLENESKEVVQIIDNQLIKFNQFENIEAIETILKLNLDVENEQKRLANFKEKRYAATTAFQALSTELKDAQYNPENHDNLKAHLGQLTKEIETQKEQCTRLEMTIKTLLLQLEESKNLSAKIKKLEARAANLKTLKSLFSGGGFVEYVSSRHLQNLCRAANERFKNLTQQQLHLEVNEKNDFQIKDMLNDGQVRSVRTLSGGQIFQAALSLAIALADSIQPLMKSKQNFFFLDEGFGALDRESLQVVFETLKALRKENRIVGVISHVEDMQQEISRYLKVTLDEVTGSMVELVG